MEEIKAGDIMINNYFGIDRGIGVVEQICTENYADWNDSHDYPVNVTVNGIYYACTLKELRPIPLTGDIMLKCGFTCHSDNSYSIEINTPDTHLVLRQVRYEFYPFIEQMAEFSSQKDNVVYLKYIKSVHELQNLFKILSGTDLKIEV